MQFKSFCWLSHHGLWAIIPCSTSMILNHMHGLLGHFYFYFSLVFYIWEAFFIKQCSTHACWIWDDCSQLISNARLWNNNYSSDNETPRAWNTKMAECVYTRASYPYYQMAEWRKGHCWCIVVCVYSWERLRIQSQMQRGLPP